MRALLVLFLFGMIVGQGYAQDKNISKNRKKPRFYAYWGWNRGYYTKSDISFKGDNYDFLLKDVVAKDRQTPFGFDPYFSPTRITIPQTNFRLGYFINDHYDISLGLDHMKYVMEQDQEVRISGYIENSNSPYDRIYDNENLVLAGDFLKFEHTDGLNYINVEVRRTDVISDLLLQNPPSFVELKTIVGIGAGVLIPKTNTTLLANERHDDFHLSGYGFGSVVGLNLTFFKRVFIQSELKGGFIDMPDIRTTKFDADRAAQHFWYVQSNILIGSYFNF